MTWVANELLLDKKYFYLECMRIPPDWHLWVYILGTEKEADEFQVKTFVFIVLIINDIFTHHVICVTPSTIISFHR